MAQRAVYLGLVISAIGLMMLGKLDAVLMERLRVGLADTVTPILAVLSGPSDAIADGFERAGEWIAVREQNTRLQVERERLIKWQSVALRLEAENAELRRLLNFVAEPEARYVTGRVVADTGGTFARSLLLHAGTANGVSKGNVAVTGEGLVGRLVSAAQHTSRVLLITDLNSRVPVMVSPGGTKAILAGDNSDQPVLIHIISEETIAPGDHVATAGDTGAFPPGIPIGVVSSVTDREVRIKPFIERSRMEYVRVVDYGTKAVQEIQPGAVSLPDSGTSLEVGPTAAWGPRPR
jgi:rod shape-determining protein MreC